MRKEYIELLAAELSNNCIYPYWKGRVALYALLKAMGIGPGDQVILPALTCVVVPNAIIYVGAQPIYVDVDIATFNMRSSAVEPLINDKTKAIICQNTFGLSSEISVLTKLANKYNLYTIEDCTHGFGGVYNNKPNGSYCDAAFYSTQWNKPFSTGVGGFLSLNNLSLKEELEQENTKLVEPGKVEQLSLRLQLLAKKHFVNSFSYWSILKLYRFLSANNVILGSSSGGEIVGVDMPENFFKGASSVQYSEGVKAIAGLEKNLILRKENAKKIF